MVHLVDDPTWPTFTYIRLCPMAWPGQVMLVFEHLFGTTCITATCRNSLAKARKDYIVLTDQTGWPLTATTQAEGLQAEPKGQQTGFHSKQTRTSTQPGMPTG